MYFQVADLTEAERRLLDGTFDASTHRHEKVSVSLAVLDSILRDSAWQIGIIDLLEGLGGPVVPSASVRKEQQRQRDALTVWFVAQAEETDPALVDWAKRTVALTRGDLHIARAHFEKVLRVLRALPGEGELLPVFASRIAGDPHGLDGSGKLARDTLAAVVAWRGVPPPAGAEEARAGFGDKSGWDAIACQSLCLWRACQCAVMTGWLGNYVPLPVLPMRNSSRLDSCKRHLCRALPGFLK